MGFLSAASTALLSLLFPHVVQYKELKLWPPHSTAPAPERLPQQPPLPAPVPPPEETLHPFPPFALADAAQCALISSSGELRDSGLGSAIDAHKLIIRVNTAPTEGFESWVGSRTDARFVSSPEACSRVLSKRMVPGAIFLRPRSGSQRRKFEAAGARTIVVPECPQSKPYIGKSDPSSGFLAALFFSHSCSSLNLVGFIARNLSAPYHYYDMPERSQEIHFQSREKMGGGHKFKQEQEILKDNALSFNGAILRADVEALRKVCSFPGHIVEDVKRHLLK